MSKFILVYKGQATDLADMTPEQGAAVLGKWRVWMDKVGPALVDVGAPFGSGVSLVDDGSTADAAALTGYSVIEAPGLATARQRAEGHPYLSEGRGNFSIEIYELKSVPFES